MAKMLFGGKQEVEVLLAGPSLSRVTPVDADDKELRAFWVSNLALTEVIAPKVGKQRGRNYDLFIQVYGLLRATDMSMSHEAITRALDPSLTDRKLHHAVSAVLSGNRDVFYNDKAAETWTLTKDASDWLVNRKPAGLTDVQKKAKAVRQFLRAIEKDPQALAPSWLLEVTLPEAQ